MLLDIKMHKAMSIIQFKVEGQIIKKNPGFKMESRNLLHHIDYEKGNNRDRRKDLRTAG